MTAVLDASAALALLRAERGHEKVAELLPGSVISALNYAEVVQKLAQLGSTTAADDTAALIALGATVANFDVAAAVNTAAPELGFRESVVRNPLPIPRETDVLGRNST